MRYLLIILLLSACRKEIVNESKDQQGRMTAQIIIGGAIKTDTQSILLDLNQLQWYGSVGGSPGTNYLISKYKLRHLENN